MGGLTPSVREFCPAKLNLFLEVHRRRADGFHDLTTVFQTIALGDDLELSRAAELPPGSIACELLGSPGSDVPADDSNLAVRAVRALLDAAGRRDALRLRLTKRVPSGGGLGGGSADAAGALRAADRLLELRTPPDALLRIASSLGSDVPFLLCGGSATATGRGEQLSPLPALPQRRVVLFVPEIALSTAAVYGALRPPDFGDRSADEVLLALRDSSNDRPLLTSHNALWSAAQRVAPDLVALRARIEAELGSPVRLTGSGSTLFSVLPAGQVPPPVSLAGLRAIHSTEFAEPANERLR